MLGHPSGQWAVVNSQVVIGHLDLLPPVPGSWTVLGQFNRESGQLHWSVVRWIGKQGPDGQWSDSQLGSGLLHWSIVI